MLHSKSRLLVSWCLGGYLLLNLSGCAWPSLSDKPDVLEAQGNLERAIALLQTTFHDQRPEIRANCIEALEPLHDRRSTSLQEQGLRDSEWVVRFSAAMVAGKQKNKALQPTLTELIQRETDASVQVAMIYALKRMGDNSHMNLLPQRLHSPSPTVRANTAMVLGLLGEPSAILVLDSIKLDSDTRVKLEVTSALARLGDPDAQNTILAMSINRFAEDYYTAIATAGDLENPDVNNVLIRGLAMKDQLKNPNPQERIILTRASLIAARSLGKRHDLRAAQMALDYLSDREPQLRALAALALGELLNSRGEHHLLPLLSDADTHVQIAAAAAIVNIGSRVQAQATQPVLTK